MKYFWLLVLALLLITACKTETKPGAPISDDEFDWDYESEQVEIDEGSQADDSADELIVETSDLEIADGLDVSADSDIDKAILEAEAELEDW